MTAPLDNLLAEIRRCRLCDKHLPLGPRPVIRAAMPARVLIVGQAPGRAVHKSGIPFDDPSGDRLRTWLGVSRDAFYDEQRFAIIPMGFCFPGTGTSGDLPPRAECAPAWREPLLAQLPNVQLTLVIGRYAMDWHLPEQKRSSVTQVVAGWRSYWPKLLPLPHPSPRNNRWLRQNPWLEDEVIPTLQAKIAMLIGTGA
ncbi:MAG: uracil-DNA glycosylase family protein [Pseudomonadota bacterium]